MLLDLLLRVGPYGLTLARLRAAPHGIDLGPLQPGRVADHVATADGRIDVAPEDFLREARHRLLAGPDDGARASLVLIGRRDPRSNNSWMHNSPRLVKGPPRCTLLVHPDAAAARGLVAGDLADMSSEAGVVTVPVEVTDAIRPGVVSLPHGWGHHRDGVRLDVARAHARRERERRDERSAPRHAERQRRLQRPAGDGTAPALIPPRASASVAPQETRDSVAASRTG